MSKRDNMNARRRQIRRALNKAGDLVKSIGVAKANRIGYGTGLTASHFSFEIKNARMNEDND